MLADHLPDVSGFVRSRLTSLKYGDIPLQDLTICQILSRELDQYSGLSSLVTAALQLQERGKTLRMEQRIRYVHVSRGPGVHSLDQPKLPNVNTLDRVKYRDFVIGVVQEVLQPLGVTETILKNWLIGGAGYFVPPGLLKYRDEAGFADTSRS